MLALPISFFLVAVLYSAAGFGGGSSYLALLALFNVDFVDLRMAALICNMIVAGNSVYLFTKSGLLNFKAALPLISLSVPLSFLGGTVNLDSETFFVLLGLTLLASSLAMFASPKVSPKRLAKSYGVAIGGFIGLISGLVGIGGGIFLSPILYFSNWDKAKSIAAVTAFYIFVNSAAGLTAQTLTNGFNLQAKFIVPLMLAVFLGGQLGSRITINKLSPIWLQRITAVVILIVALRILNTNLLNITILDNSIFG